MGEGGNGNDEDERGEGWGWRRETLEMGKKIPQSGSQ